MYSEIIYPKFETMQQLQNYSLAFSYVRLEICNVLEEMWQNEMYTVCYGMAEYEISYSNH